MNLLLFVLKRLALDIVLPLLDVASDLYTAYLYYKNGEANLAIVTVSLVCMPGLMEFLYWTACLVCRKCSLKEFLVWSAAFGPLTFPISNAFWHFYVTLKGRTYYKEKYSMSMVLRSLEAFSESAPQLLFQTTILITRWNIIDNKIGILICVSVSSLFLSATAVEHHIHECSAKNVIPKLRSVWSCVPFFLVNILIRTFCLAVLASYLHWWTVAVVAVVLITNFISSASVFRTDVPKNFWTAAASIVGLASFVSRGDVDRYKCLTFNYFYRYFVVNAVSTFVILGAAMGCAVGLLASDHLAYQCRNLPVFSCFEDDRCGESRMCSDDESPHELFFIAVAPAWTALLVLHVLLVSLIKLICPSLMNATNLRNCASIS